MPLLTEGNPPQHLYDDGRVVMPTNYVPCYLPNRAFGVELETSKKLECPTGWKWKYDGSVNGLEYLSGPCLGKEGVKKITDGCKSLSDPKESVNQACGFHIHLNARDISETQLANFMRFCHKYQGNILGFVAKSRHNGDYCRLLPSELADITGGSIADWSNNNGRYFIVNSSSYYRRGTIEIRVHQGTTNHKKVLNWAELWLKLLNFGIKKENWEGKNLSFWKVAKLAKVRRSTIQYYKARAKELHELESNEYFVVSANRTLRRETYAPVHA
jgi:hypothetical protein